nr:hypothetical protein CFP56_75428 [Quercus suber]
MCRPYGEWLRAGIKTKPGGPRSTEDSSPQHSPAPVTPTSPKDPRVDENPVLTLVDVTGNIEFRGVENTDTCEGSKPGFQGTDKEGLSPQIMAKLQTDPDALKHSSMETNFTPIQWDRGKVDTWFQPPSRDTVLRVRLGNLESQDTLVWNENKAQTLSVRTAYQVAFRMNHTGSAEHSRVHEDKRVWNGFTSSAIARVLHGV